MKCGRLYFSQMLTTMSPRLQLFLQCDFFTPPIEKSLSLNLGKFGTVVEKMFFDIWGYIIKDKVLSIWFFWYTYSWNPATMLWGCLSSHMERSWIGVLADNLTEVSSTANINHQTSGWGIPQMVPDPSCQVTPRLWTPADTTKTK